MTSNFLGVISFALEDYPRAVEHFDSSLQLLLQEGSEGLYLAWINLADSYKANSDKDKAKDAYRNAILLADKTKMNDPNDKNIDAHIFYSNLHLLKLTQESLSVAQMKDLIRQLDELQEGANDHSAFVRIMLSWVELDNLEKARPIFQQFSQSCKGYASYPILKRLFEQDKKI
jgi:tetratricopeptide (TPR) repeat protein